MWSKALAGDQAESSPFVTHEVQQHLHLRFGQPPAARIDVAEQHDVITAQLLRSLREAADRVGPFLHEPLVGFDKEHTGLHRLLTKQRVFQIAVFVSRIALHVEHVKLVVQDRHVDVGHVIRRGSLIGKRLHLDAVAESPGLFRLEAQLDGACGWESVRPRGLAISGTGAPAARGPGRTREKLAQSERFAGSVVDEPHRDRCRIGNPTHRDLCFDQRDVIDEDALLGPNRPDVDISRPFRRPEPDREDRYLPASRQSECIFETGGLGRLSVGRQDDGGQSPAVGVLDCSAQRAGQVGTSSVRAEGFEPLSDDGKRLS